MLYPWTLAVAMLLALRGTPCLPALRGTLGLFALRGTLVLPLWHKQTSSSATDPGARLFVVVVLFSLTTRPSVISI